MKINVLLLILILTLGLSCKGGGGGGSSVAPSTIYALSMEMTRIPVTGVDPFIVKVTLKKNGVALSGQTLVKTVSQGSSTAITDNNDGTYSFTVTPSTTGTYPVTVSFSGATITRKAVVLDNNMTGTGQPIAIPGDYVNTDGYEDGATITPDGEYLFVHYGPFYFSGLANFTTICSSGSYSAGYDLNNCHARTNSSLVFDTMGPYTAPYRPNFPVGNIAGGDLQHFSNILIGGVANGIVAFPTVFYGFKRQSDGSFASPFKVAFNDEKGVNGPYGLSFKMNGNNTSSFVVAWNNYFNDLGNDKADVYSGTITLGQDNNLGDVVYAGDFFSSITPYITPVNFSAHTDVQGNPHMYYDGSGVVKSIWTDDEQVSHDLSVYRITAGTFPTGTWTRDTLPSDINTGAEESQPFFTGDKLILRRGANIVYHDYTPTNGSCASGYTHNDCWGAEVVLIGANGNTNVGEIFTVGEPTVATYGGKKYLYFVYVQRRANLNISGIIDWDIDVASVEIP